MKAPGYFKLFECGKMFFNNLYTAYICAGMENPKEKYCPKIYDIITNYNDRNHTPLSNAKINEEIDQVII